MYIVHLPATLQFIIERELCTSWDGSLSKKSNPQQAMDSPLQEAKEQNPFSSYLNPLDQNISMHTLHTVLYTTPKELTRSIC